MKTMRYLSLTLFLLMLLSCNEQSRKLVSDIASEKKDWSQESYDIHVAFIDSNGTKAVITANRARVYDNGYTVLDGNVKVIFYSQNEEVADLLADTLKVEDRSKNMFAKGHIVANSMKKNLKLTTETLNWDNKKRLLYTDEFVHIVSDTEDIQGYGMESDDKFQNYRIFKVTGIKEI